MKYDKKEKDRGRQMTMAIEPLTECIQRAVHQAQFRNVYGNCFESSVMHELYAKKIKRGYCLSNMDAISVRETELTALVSELLPMVVRYRSPQTGAVGNGLYMLMGSSASPRLPSVEDYAKVLVLAAARVGSERVANLFTGWLEGPTRTGLAACLTQGSDNRWTAEAHRRVELGDAAEKRG